MDSAPSPEPALRIDVRGFSKTERMLIEGVVRLSQRRTPRLELVPEEQARSADVLLIDGSGIFGKSLASSPNRLVGRAVLWIDNDSPPPGHFAMARPVLWSTLPAMLALAVQARDAQIRAEAAPATQPAAIPTAIEPSPPVAAPSPAPASLPAPAAAPAPPPAPAAAPVPAPVPAALPAAPAARQLAPEAGPAKAAAPLPPRRPMPASRPPPVRLTPPAPAPVAPPVAAPVAPVVDAQMASRPRLLVVDDSLAVRNHLRSLLEFCGFSVTEAPDVRTALEIVQGERFSCVLMDVLMPDTDGYEGCKRIKGMKSRIGALPVVMLTSKSSPFDKIRGKMAGCDAYLTKPVDPARLYEVLAQYAGMATTQGQPGRGAPGR